MLAAEFKAEFGKIYDEKVCDKKGVPTGEIIERPWSEWLERAGNAPASLRAIEKALALSPPEDQAGWRDIATAKKDGVPFIGATYRPDLASPFSHPDILPWERCVIWWDAEFYSDWDEVTEDTVYRGAWTSGRVADWGAEEYYEEHPTLWQPLPAPPPPQDR